MTEFLDATEPLDDVDEELADLLMELHPESKQLRALPGELLRKQHEMDDMAAEMEAMRQELETYKLERKLGGRGVVRLVSHNDEQEEDEAANNPYKLQSSALPADAARVHGGDGAEPPFSVQIAAFWRKDSSHDALKQLMIAYADFVVRLDLHADDLPPPPLFESGFSLSLFLYKHQRAKL